MWMHRKTYITQKDMQIKPRHQPQLQLRQPQLHQHLKQTRNHLKQQQLRRPQLHRHLKQTQNHLKQRQLRRRQLHRHLNQTLKHMPLKQRLVLLAPQAVRQRPQIALLLSLTQRQMKQKQGLQTIGLSAQAR